MTARTLKLLAAVTLLILASWSPPEAKTVYVRTALTGGGTTALDGVDGTVLAEGDLAQVTLSGTIYFYYLNATSGAAQSLPSIVSPATNAGLKRWILQNTNVQPRPNLLSNSQFSVWSNGTLENAAGNLAVNGAFTSDTSSWTAGNATLATAGSGQAGNCLQVTNSGTNYGYAYQAITTVAGKLYRAQVYFKKGTATGGILLVGTAAATGDLGTSGTMTDASWTAHTVIFKASGTTTYLTLYNAGNTASQTALYDETTFYEVTPGCVAADTLGPDEWAKSTSITLYRQFSDATYTTRGSFYSLKAVGGASASYVFWPRSRYTDPAWIARFAGRTVTVGCWVWTSAPSKARIYIHDSQFNLSSYHTGSGAWEWLEVTRTVPSTGTTWFAVYLEPGTSNTAWFSEPMLAMGSGIGAGNYSPRPGEIIWLEKRVASAALDNRTGFSTTAWTSLDIEVDSGGLIGAGAMAVWVSAQANDSGSAAGTAYLALGDTSSDITGVIVSPRGLTNDAPASASGAVPLSSAGAFKYSITATGSATFDVPRFKYYGVQVQ